jgi:hypothetical protein
MQLNHLSKQDNQVEKTIKMADFCQSSGYNCFPFIIFAPGQGFNIPITHLFPQYI